MSSHFRQSLGCVLLMLLALAARAGEPGPVKIMPLGDSITAGDKSGGYRWILFKKCKEAGYAAEFVGSSHDGSKDAPAPNHEGHGGFTIGPGPSKADEWSNGHGNIYDNIEKWMKADPDAILLMIGTNEFFNSKIPGNKPEEDGPKRLAALIDKIYTIKPGVTIFVASLVPFAWDHNATHGFNKAAARAVEERKKQGKSIYFVDMHNKSKLEKGDYADPVHPNPTGYAKLANVWFQHVAPWLKEKQGGK